MMTRKLLEEAQHVAQQALERWASTRDLDARVSSGSCSGGSCTFSVRVALKDSDGVPLIPEREAFFAEPPTGMTADWMGRQFQWGAKCYRIIGKSTQSSSRNVLCEEIVSKRRRRFADHQVVRAIRG